MPVYTTGFQTVAAAAGAPYATFHTVASRRGFIRQISFFTTQPIQSAIGIVYPSNTPVATTSTAPVAMDQADATATCAADTAWSTAPTIAATPNWLAQFTLGPATGAGFIMPLARDEMIVIAKSTYIVFWNFGAIPGAALSAEIVFEE
jgi:hypothetical protein